MNRWTMRKWLGIAIISGLAAPGGASAQPTPTPRIVAASQKAASCARFCPG